MQRCSNNQIEMITDLLGKFLKKFREAAFIKFKEYGFTVTQFSLMHILYRDPDLMLNELSEKMGLSKSTVSSIVERLEKQAIVVREIPKDNRRIVKLSLSKEFIKKHKDLLDVRHKFVDEIFKFQDLSIKDADSIIHALKLMTGTETR